MAANEQKRQKKLAKQQSREKKAKRELARKKAEMSSLAGRMRAAGRYPVLDCKATPLGRKPYLGTVLLSRRMPGGEIAFASFLLDCGCLGVKDATGTYCTMLIYKHVLAGMADSSNLADIAPERGRALIEQSVQYAAGLGFSPHVDFHKAFPLFADIDSSQCTEKFPMGSDEGRPIFISGPDDDAAKKQAIFAQLTQAVGPQNFDFVDVGAERGWDGEDILGLADEGGDHRFFEDVFDEDDDSADRKPWRRLR